MAELIGSRDYKVYDHLIGGTIEKLRTKVVTLAASGKLRRGTLLGKDADGKFGMVDGAKVTSADCVLADDTDATEEINAVVYISGEFNREALIVNSDVKISDYEDELRKLNILLTSVRGM